MSPVYCGRVLGALLLDVGSVAWTSPRSELKCDRPFWPHALRASLRGHQDRLCTLVGCFRARVWVCRLRRRIMFLLRCLLVLQAHGVHRVQCRLFECITLDVLACTDRLSSPTGYFRGGSAQWGNRSCANGKVVYRKAQDISTGEGIAQGWTIIEDCEVRLHTDTQTHRHTNRHTDTQTD